jgi:lipoprotein signal peptidase
MLSVTTPFGVAWGLLEAWRFHWWLAVLMAVLVAVIAVFFWITVRRIRAERDAAAAGTSTRVAAPHGDATRP